MSAHYISLTICSLLMYAQYACAQEARIPASREKAEQQIGRSAEASKEKLAGERDAGATFDSKDNLTARNSGESDLDGPPTPAADERFASRNVNAGNREKAAQTASGSDLYTRVTKEYYSQSASPTARQEKPGTLSKFGLRYSQAGSDHIWLEYRFSDKGALRLRGAAHRGVRVLAVFEY